VRLWKDDLSYCMKSSRRFGNPGMVLVGLFLLPVLALAWCIPRHADVHSCAGDCAHSRCCGGHSMPLLSANNPVPNISHFTSPAYVVEEQPAYSLFASSIFRPPPGLPPFISFNPEKLIKNQVAPASRRCGKRARRPLHGLFIMYG